jgi:hypothetical protein
VIGMFMIAFASEGVVLTLGNVLCCISMAAAGIGPIFGAISRHTPPEKRSIALGVTIRAGRLVNSPSCRSRRCRSIGDIGPVMDAA